MRAYLIYKDKSIKGFRKLINSGSGIFDRYRTVATKFIRYASTTLDENLAEYDNSLDINTIMLEQVFPTKYRWLVSNRSLVASRNYLKSLESRITEFEGKEDNLKILVGTLFLKFVLITKIVETYLATISNMKESGMDVKRVELKSVGIDKTVLKYFDQLQDLQDKSIDDWLNINIDNLTAKHYYMSMKRILMILMSMSKSD